jgi:hypothetical protein
MNLRVEFYFDPESRNWGFRVPSLRINGSSRTRQEAEKEVLEAINFALEPLDDEIDNDVDEVAYFDVQVTPAKVEAPAR